MPTRVQVTNGWYMPIRYGVAGNAITNATQYTRTQPFDGVRDEIIMTIEGVGLTYAGAELTGGTITSISYSHRFTATAPIRFIVIFGGAERIDGLNVDAAAFMSLYNAQDWAAMDALLFSEPVVYFEGAQGSTFHSGNGDDVVINASGSSTYVTGGGNDYVITGASSANVIAGSGNDTVFGGDYYGYSPNLLDRVWGGDGADFVMLRSGNDFASGDAGDDSIYGGTWNDVLLGGDGNDILSGGSDNDYVAGEAGSDVVFGDDGNDTLSGGSEADWLYGGAGADLAAGDAGDDYLAGEAGNDTVVGGAGYNLISLGPGQDIIQSNAADGGTHYVYDFSVADGDMIWLVGSSYGSVSAALASAVAVAGGTWMGNGTDAIFLAGISPAQLTASNVVLF